jgi:hypothetical protein
MDTLHGDQCTLLGVSCSFLLRMRNISDKSCRENQNTHFVFSILFLSCCLWNNEGKYYIAGQATDDCMAYVHMCIAFWISKATNTHAQYVILLLFNGNSGCTIAP